MSLLVNGVSYDTLQEALEHAKDGETVTLLTDISLTETIVVNNNVTLTGGSLTRGAGNTGYLLDIRGNLKLTDITIDGGYKEDGTGVTAVKPMLNVADGATLEVTSGVVLQNNNNTYLSGVNFGGAVYVSAGGTFNMTGGIIQGNSAKVGGGIHNFGTFYMTGGTITKNTASAGPGGGLCNNGGSFTAQNGAFSFNAADKNAGGGVWSNSSMTMTGCTVNGNTASLGGGIYVQDVNKQANGEITVVATLSNCTVSSNTALGKYGGGVWCNGKLVMDGGEISHNTSTTQGGGVYGGGNFEISGTISNNESNAGGGIFNYYNASSGPGGICIIKNGAVITENNARSSQGGGICAWNNTELVIEDGSVISNNTASVAGGGIYIYGKMTMTGGTISGNTVNGVEDNILNDNGGEQNEGLTITSGTFTFDPTEYLGEGYCVKVDGDTYTVAAHTVEKVNAVAATCKEEGIKEHYACAHCGKTYSDALGQNETDDRFTPVVAHTYGEWVVTKEATATEAGVREKVCSVCGDKITEEIPATGKTEPMKPTEPTKPADPVNVSTPSNTNGNTVIPQTGDTSNIVLYGMLLLLSGAGIMGVNLHNRRKERSN